MDSGNGHQRLSFPLLFVTALELCRILSPFFGAVLWGVALAVLFQPVQCALVARTGKRPNLVALATSTLIVLIVILPVIFVTAAVVQKIDVAYQQIQGVQPNHSRYLSGACPLYTSLSPRDDRSS